MLGRSKYWVDGKTLRHQPDTVITEYFPVHISIFNHYKNVILSMDVVHANQIPFLVNVSKDIYYDTIKALDSMQIPVVKMVLEMFGRSKYWVEGKILRHQLDTVITESFSVHISIFDYYKNIVLSMDVVHVNQFPFLVSVSKNIHYGTITALDSMNKPVMEDKIKRSNRMYAVRGFHMEYVLVDTQFKAIKDCG